jgi:DNA polymerase-3 subunit gamma/tau
MAYLAMARKWRPKNFEEMVGQDHIAQTIRNAIGGKRISHAYLFTGTRGVGKTTSARILAKALNCERGPTPTPCDACRNCLAVSAGNSMDVLEIDAASNTGVDNIRDLREQVKYAPMHGTYKIYIVDEVHMLSKSAFNALLKTLEEPPEHVVFIFATTEANKVPHTILSRVQRFDFKRISEARIRERLEYICAQEGIKPEREALEALARKADGSMRDALSLFDQVYAFSGSDLSLAAARKVLGLPRDEMFDALVRALVAHDQKACFDLLQEAHREGIETGDLLVAFGEYLRNLLFALQGVSPAVLGLGDARHAELAALASDLRLRDGDILRFAKIVSDLLSGLKSAANPRLTVELGFARMASLDRVVTLSQLLGGDLPPLQAAVTGGSPAGLPSAPPPTGTRPAVTGHAAHAPAPPAEVKKKSPEPLTVAPPAEVAGSAPAEPGPAGMRAEAVDFPPDAAPDPAAGMTDGLDAPAEASASLETANSRDTRRECEPGRRDDAAPEFHRPLAAGAASESLAIHAGPSATALIEAPPGLENRASVAERPDAADAGHAELLPPEAAGSAIGPGTASAEPPADVESAYPEIEQDPEPDPDYPVDPEEPGMDAAAMRGDGYTLGRAGAGPAGVEEQGTVPIQPDPARLPPLWPRLIAELMTSRPLMATHLRLSRLERDADGSGALRLVFLDRAAHSLLADDGDFRKSIHAFLAGKLADSRDFQLRHHLDEAAAAAADEGAAPVPTALPGDPLAAEPIVAYIRRAFEGRTL